ncbi:hypothetical protein GCM10007100_02240 [Roseibacillus persicicus]|uniref:Uncharacterized protein n=2 Tax=Roseibacillus persicicus TaxID=454148 RepID=A0A918TBW4_9BACT|nr:hypothetical protein GCM10007100_02240 [Roseibacillus persicicus]
MRAEVEKVISIRHWNFARYYVLGETGNGLFTFRRRAYVAYLKAYPNVMSKSAAKASASRLMRKPHIQAAIQWQAVILNGENRGITLYPDTAIEIWEALRELGSFRANWAPWWVKSRWEDEGVSG